MTAVQATHIPLQGAPSVPASSASAPVSPVNPGLVNPGPVGAAPINADQERLAVQTEPPQPVPPLQADSQLQTLTLFRDHPLLLDCGRPVSNVRVAYHSYGTPGPHAVLVAHALTGTSAVHDWWPALFGAGKVRGRGLLVGVQLASEPGPLVKAARDEGLIVGPAGNNTLRIAPPLIVTTAHIDELLEKLSHALRAMKG